MLPRAPSSGREALAVTYCRKIILENVYLYRFYARRHLRRRRRCRRRRRRKRHSFGFTTKIIQVRPSLTKKTVECVVAFKSF